MKKKNFEDLINFNETEVMYIKFEKDGWESFYTDQVRNKEKTAERFLKLCLTIINNPETVYHAFELCGKNEINEQNWVKEAVSEIKKQGRRY